MHIIYQPLYHFTEEEEVKQSLDNDIAKNTIEPVPTGVPVEWCSKMIVVPKKDGRPRRTVDL